MNKDVESFEKAIKEIEINYKIEPILFHLKHIKRMCLDNPDCTGCPFNLSNDYCIFAGYQFDEGVIPEDWDLESLRWR